MNYTLIINKEEDKYHTYIFKNFTYLYMSSGDSLKVCVSDVLGFCDIKFNKEWSINGEPINITVESDGSISPEEFYGDSGYLKLFTYIKDSQEAALQKCGYEIFDIKES